MHNQMPVLAGASALSLAGLLSGPFAGPFAGPLVGQLVGTGGAPEFGSGAFADPVPLTSGDAVLGADVRYPSPRCIDVDGDGAREILVGDLNGLVQRARPEAGADSLAWEALAPIKTDGRTLKFNNW